MSNKWKFLFLAGVIVCASVLAFGADTITKGLIGKEDIYLGTDNVPAQTFSRATSTGGTITLTRLNGSHIPWDNSYTATIRPKNITGNGSGTISGYGLSISTLSLSSTLAVTGASTFTGTGTFQGSLVSNSFTTGALTSTGITVNGTTTSTIGAFGRVTIDNSVRDTGTAAPTTGTYAAGDIVYNLTPAQDNVISDNPFMWYCSVAGTPGTWVAVYRIFKVAPTTATSLGKPGMTAYDNTYFYANSPTIDNSWKRVALSTW